MKLNVQSVLAILGIALVSAPASAQFETRAIYPVLQSPNSIAVGDFNHDGKLDMAVACSLLSTQVSVLLGNGDGTFEAPVNYTAGSDPISVVAADFNGDGNLDLAVADEISNNVNILLGNGDGTFQAPRAYNTPNPPSYVAVGDFNNDNKLDLVLINAHLISLMLGNGDGTFQPPINITPSFAPGAVGVGDFDHNGKLDLAVGEQFGGISQVEILLGNGDGTFQFGASYPVGPDPSSIAVADFRGTGERDLAVASYEGTGITVLLGNGDGTFQPPVSYASYSARWVTAGDLNGDGKPDLAIANFSITQSPPTTVASVMLGNGDGTFQPPVTYPVGKASTFVAIADFNNDKELDLVVTDWLRNDVVVLLNTGTMSLSPTTPLNFPAQLLGTQGVQTVKLTNSGTSPLTISSMLTKAPFGVTSTCKSPVAPGITCSLSVNFSPKTQGAKSGALSIADSASGKPQVIELSGEGTVVKLSPLGLDFGMQKVGTDSAPQSVELTNTGTTALNISQILIGSFEYTDFSQSNTCRPPIAAGASCTISVIFHPARKGSRSAFVSITDSGGSSPQRVSLIGTGD
jgi:hypothetical protein